MSSLPTTRRNFVVFPVGGKRFALPAEQVNELAAHQRFNEQEQQTFPHTTPLLTGVVVRRGQIVPVVDLTSLLVGSDVPAKRFYLVVSMSTAGEVNRAAIPVTGECELAYAEPLPATADLPPHVTGLLPLRDDVVQVLDLESVMSMELWA